jgi:phosphate starvation-inducible PhoH-like protein
VRHTLVGEIVDAYTEHDQRQMAKQARKQQSHQQRGRGR